jgi:hypothetical protein
MPLPPKGSTWFVSSLIAGPEPNFDFATLSFQEPSMGSSAAAAPADAAKTASNANINRIRIDFLPPKY